jgi:fructosamine-3-kinase
MQDRSPNSFYSIYTVYFHNLTASLNALTLMIQKVRPPIVMSRGLIGDIFQAHGITDGITRIDGCGGGCISSAFVAATAKATYFVKTNSVSFEPQFRAEFAGLEHIAKTNTILCPKPFFVGALTQCSYLVMSYLPNLSGGSAAIGPPLAKMHLAGQTEKFGFPITTFCGATELDNTQSSEPWSEWFSKHRIGYILNQLGSKTVTDKPIETVTGRIAELLREHDADVTPSLVHGDLWAGNGGMSDGTPCIFDPACYYGDPEVDLAMSEFFGGFGGGLLRTYETVKKVSPGYNKRKKIYNLYHALNHALLFGGGYISQSRSIIEGLFR